MPTANRSPTQPLAMLIYGRQSKNRKVSIRDQLRSGQARADTEEWHVAAVLSDGTGASKHSTGSRSDWPRAVQMMEAGEADGIWLWEQSRGGRIASEFLIVLATCARLGVKVYIEEHERMFDPNDDHDWEVLAKQAVDDEAETNKLRRRIMRSKTLARASGDLRRVLGHQPPIGYAEEQYTDEEGDPAFRWTTDPRHQAMLGEITERMLPPFEERLADAYASWTEANGDLYYNLAGGGRGEKITARAVHYALRRPVTAGLLTGPPVRDDNGKWKRRGEIIRQVVDDPPLDPGIWEALQRYFAAKPRGREPDPASYPHSKVLACGRVLPDGTVCGNQLSGLMIYPGFRSRPDRPYPRGQYGVRAYSCKTRHKITETSPAEFKQPCYGVSIPAEGVNELLQLAVRQWWAEHPELAVAAADQEGTSAERAALHARRDELGRQSEEFGLKWRTRVWSEEHYRAMDESVTRELARVQAELDELDDRDREAAEATPGLPEEIEQWDALSPEEKNRWVRKAFHTPILVTPAGGRHLTVDERVTLIARVP
jgi:Resolvase, N terminal domain